jgi:hypothetical protein
MPWARRSEGAEEVLVVVALASAGAVEVGGRGADASEAEGVVEEVGRLWEYQG